MGAGRVALVTGAARGIGAATVDALVADGYRVLAIDVGPGAAPPGVDYPLADPEDLLALERRHQGAVLARLVDVRDLDGLTAAAGECVEHFGALDAVVAAAAVVVGGRPQWQTPAEHLRTLLDVDVVGVWNTAAATVPLLLAAPDPGACRFVAIASAAGERGLFGLAGYSAAKHAVIGIVRGLAADLVGTGVTAVAVSPGSTRTAMLDATAALYDTGVGDLAGSQLLRRLIEPAEVARVVRFCCSPDGAVLNGSVVDAGGGFTG